MNNKLINTKWFLYLTEFFAGMSVMAVELGASRLMAPYLVCEAFPRSDYYGGSVTIPDIHRPSSNSLTAFRFR